MLLLLSERVGKGGGRDGPPAPCKKQVCKIFGARQKRWRERDLPKVPVCGPDFAIFIIIDVAPTSGCSVPGVAQPVCLSG